MPPTEQGFETFTALGQKRYKCNYTWPNGQPCNFDTYDLLVIMKDHLAGHAAYEKEVRKQRRGERGEMPSRLFGPDGNPLIDRSIE